MALSESGGRIGIKRRHSQERGGGSLSLSTAGRWEEDFLRLDGELSEQEGGGESDVPDSKQGEFKFKPRSIPSR